MSEGILHIRDSRTALEYEFEIRQNTIRSADFNNIVAPSEGTNPAYRVAKGLRLFDEGLQHTANHESKITWVDGENGFLLFRGYSFDQLSEFGFEEMLHLLVWGKIPTVEQTEELRAQIAELICNIPPCVFSVIRAFPPSSPSVPMVVAGLAAFQGAEPTILPAHNGGNTYHNNPELVDLAIIHTVAVYCAVAGIAQSHKNGTEFLPPSPDVTFYENFLTMAGIVDKKTGKPSDLHMDCARRSAAFGADHEISNSTFSLLVTASSLADPISSLISAIMSAYGPLHMGACESAYRTMGKMKLSDVPLLIDAVKSKKTRLYGYGHRMYKTEDPRVAPMKELLRRVDATNHPILATAMEIDRIACTDEYFVSRKLYANLDLYVMFLGIAMGFSADFLPITMILERLPGFMAHWREAMLERKIKLIRPAGLYSGPTVPIALTDEQRAAAHSQNHTASSPIDLERTPNSSTPSIPVLITDPVTPEAYSVQHIQTFDVKSTSEPSTKIESPSSTFSPDHDSLNAMPELSPQTSASTSSPPISRISTPQSAENDMPDAKPVAFSSGSGKDYLTVDVTATEVVFAEEA